MIYYVGPLATVQEITETPWVRPSLDGTLGITKREAALDPVPTGVEAKTHAEALTLTHTPEWEPPPPDTE
jgi:hypothetical protein